MAKLKDIAKACKSKNAGPFELTLDIMFDNEALFQRVRQSGVITPKLIADLYDIDVLGEVVNMRVNLEMLLVDKHRFIGVRHD